MTAAFLAGVVAGYGVAVPVGAIAALIVSLSARTSWRVGAAAGLGTATADGLFALVAVLGGAALAGLVGPVGGPMRWIAAAVLVGIAIRTALSAVRRHRGGVPAQRTPATTPGRAYLGLLGLTALNPTTIVYFGALVLGRQATAAVGPAAGAAFVRGAFVASATWQLRLAGGGAALGRVLVGRTARLLTALVSSAVILALAVALAPPV